jgi:ubiquinol-cytochrome c reductase cytochrome b subunit
VIAPVARWLDDRVWLGGWARRALNKAFPDHWSFLLGEIAMYCFAVLVATGVFLTLFFQPSAEAVVYSGSYEPLQGVEVTQAYASVLDISFDVRAGLLVRQVHHWAALVFVAAIVLHLLRVFFTGAFRRPREINWMVGVTMLLLAMFSGYTGYSLPSDLLSGAALRIGTAVLQSIPFIGTWSLFLLLGGEFPSPQMIPRLFTFHVLLLPVAIGGLLGVHVAILWHQKHTQFPGGPRTDKNVVGPPLWPAYMARSAGLFCAVAAVVIGLGALFQINPVWLYGPFNPSTTTAPAQPDWYWGWMDGALRTFPNWEFRGLGRMIANPFFPGVLLPALTFLGLYAWPFLEARLTGDRSEHQLLDRPRDHPVRSGIGAGVVAFYTLLTVAGVNDTIARLLDQPVFRVTGALRVAILVVPVLIGLLTWRALAAVKDAPPTPAATVERGGG